MQIGKDGRLQEWLEDWGDIEEAHRHLSHLYGLYPGYQISPERTPELAAAAKKSVLQRGDGGLSFSMAWKVNLWARLYDGDHAMRVLRNLIGSRLFPNMFSKDGQALQVDGNLGGTAGINEMLLQSHAGQIVLLPALPPEWPAGSVTGLRARGGFEVAIEWNAGKLVRCRIRSDAGHPCQVRYGNKISDVRIRKGTECVLDGALDLR
jgi:alpha-L-fucosidase 2